MRKNKLILFDWGGIVESHLTGYSCVQAWEDLFVACGYHGDAGIFKSLSKYRVSAIVNDKEFRKVYKEIKKDFNLTSDYDSFVQKYYEIFDKIDYYEDVRNYELSLKNECYVGILSNLTIFDKVRLDKQVGLNNYDYVFLSFELSSRKPDLKIYEKVQEQLPFNKKDILFIDDREDNVLSAQEFGWNAYCTNGLKLEEIKSICNSFLKD